MLVLSCIVTGQHSYGVKRSGLGLNAILCCCICFAMDMLWHMLLLQNLSVTVVNLYVDIYKASETLHLKASFRAYQSLLASIVFLLAFTLQLLDKLYYRPLLWRPTMLSSLTNFYVFTLIEWTFYHDLFLTALYWTTLTMKTS